MSDAPKTLSRPLAARVNDLPAPDNTASGVGENTPALIEGAAAALDAGKTKYTNRPGIVPLREWIAADLTRRLNVAYEADDITVTCGAAEARFVAVKALCEPGTHLICPGDTASIAGAAQLAGVSVQPDVVDADKVSAVYLTPNDTNARPLLEQASANDWWVIFDLGDADADHHPAQDEPLKPQTVTIGEFEPSGWRVGYMAGSSVHAKLRSYKQSMTICSPSVSQWAVLAMLEAES